MSPEARSWLEVARTLELEAEDGEPGVRAHRLAAAAVLYRDWVGDHARAESLLKAAQQAGHATPALLRDLADLVAERGDFAELCRVFEERAALVEEPRARAEALQDAALVARNNLRDDALAVRLLETSSAADSEDYFSCRLLRDLYLRLQSWPSLPPVLGRMAQLATGSLAAEYYVEQGQILESRLGRDEEALAAYQAARAADPAYTPAFLSLERHFLRLGSWADLARLYQSEAERSTGADARTWFVRAARVWWTRVADTASASSAWDEVAKANPTVADRVEHRAFLHALQRWDELVRALQAEARHVKGPTSALASFEAGFLLESRIGKPDEALKAYRAALKADPESLPAVEAIARLLQAKGDHEGRVALWETQAARTPNANLAISLLYQAAVACEYHLLDDARARAFYETILDRSAAFLPAIEGLDRVYRRMGLTRERAALLEQRAATGADPEVSALHLYRSGLAWELGAPAPEAAELYRRALDAAPDHVLAFDALGRMLEAQEKWGELATVAQRAAQATRDGARAAGLWHLAGRLLAEHGGDRDTAVKCLKNSLELSPDFHPARVVLRDVLTQLGDASSCLGLLRAEADATEDPGHKAWLLYQALLLATSLPEMDLKPLAEGILAVQADHGAAFEMLIRLAAARGDRPAEAERLVAWATASSDEALAQAARLQTVLLRTESGDDVAAVQILDPMIASGTDLPSGALARLCEGLGYWEPAARLLEQSSSGDRYRDLGRLREVYLHDAPGALAAYQAAVAVRTDDFPAWVGLERLLTASGDHASLAQVQRALMEASPTPAVRGLHALLSAHRYEMGGMSEEARALYEAALEARPGRGKAFDGLQRMLVAARDGAGIRDLFARVGITGGVELAGVLLDIEDTEGAVAALKTGLESEEDPLPSLFLLGRWLESSGDWPAVFENLTRIRSMVRNPEVQATVDRSQRRVLADHLASTEEAWDFYRQLLDQNPKDPEILDAMAGIAAARGDDELAVRYLEQREAVATSDPERAEVLHRLAQLHKAFGRGEQARDVWLRVLNLVPEDLAALGGLQSLAEEGEDWRSLVGILSRRAVLAEGARQTALYADIARIWQDRLEEPPVAADAWRKVLDLDPSHQEAHERLMGLAEAARDWKAFVDHGEALAQVLGGAERSAVLRRVGTAYEEELDRPADAIHLLEAAAYGDAPDVEAARMLERIHSARGDWEEAVHALLAIADAVEGDERMEALAHAAHIRDATLRNREQASEIYARMLEEQPDCTEALSFQCAYLFEKGAWAEAVPLFERLEPVEATRDLEDFDEQMEVAQFYFRYGETLRGLGRTDDALARYERTLELNQSHLPSLEAVAPIYVEMGRWEQADNALRTLLQLTGGQGDPAFLARVYTQLGHVQRQLGDLDKAQKRFNKALEFHPNDVPALLGLADILFDRGEWNALLNVYNNVIFHARERAEVVNAYLAKGFVLDRKMNLAEKAADHYRKSLNFDVSEPRALLRLAELSLRKGTWSEAGTLVDQALGVETLEPGLKADLLLARGIVRLMAEDLDAARSALMEATQCDAAVSDALAVVDPTNASEILSVLGERISSSRR